MPFITLVNINAHEFFIISPANRSHEGIYVEVRGQGVGYTSSTLQSTMKLFLEILLLMQKTFFSP